MEMVVGGDYGWIGETVGLKGELTVKWIGSGLKSSGVMTTY